MSGLWLRARVLGRLGVVAECLWVPLNLIASARAAVGAPGPSPSSTTVSGNRGVGCLCDRMGPEMQRRPGPGPAVRGGPNLLGGLRVCPGGPSR